MSTIETNSSSPTCVWINIDSDSSVNSLVIKMTKMINCRIVFCQIGYILSLLKNKIVKSSTSPVDPPVFHSPSLLFHIEQATWIATITRLLRSLEMRLSLFIWTTAEGKPFLLSCNVLAVLHTSFLKAPHNSTANSFLHRNHGNRVFLS